MTPNRMIAILATVLFCVSAVQLAAQEASAAVHGSESAHLAAGSFTLSFDREGRPASCRRKTDGATLLRAGNGGQGFYLKGPDVPAVRLNRLSLAPDGRLSVRSDDGTKEIIFGINRGQRHLALRIERVVGVPAERLEELCFEMNSDPQLRALNLDYMTQADNRDQGIRVVWPAFWHRSPQDPLGGFAIYEHTGGDDEDATLVRIWVEEKLPHPKVNEAWTVERARQWISDWQHRFANRDQLILAGKSIAELREGVAFARRAGLKQIYLFTDTWRTDAFWPVTDLNWGVNRAVFPRGEADLHEFSDFVRSRGMYLALHYVSGGIGLRDPVYVGQKPDRRFASWGGGQLTRAVGSADTTLSFQPAPGVVPPGQHRPAYPRFFEWNMLRLGDELVRIGSLVEEANGTWTLRNCQRAQGSTVKAAHAQGEAAVGLLLAYGQNLVPENDSSLLDEVAKNYAGLLNRCVVEHAEFDGAEIHAHEGRWGYGKFATRIYEALDHPTTSHDSGGTHPASWFEYRLNSSQRLMRGSCPYTHGNYSVPVTLATPSRPATTLLDAHFTLSQGNYGGALGISKPEPMFGVTPQVLREHGLTEEFIAALGAWRDISALLTDKQREQINATFARPVGLAAAFNRHLCSAVVPVARKVDGHYEILPTRVLTRKTGDILWQHGQEHGAISPQQFIKPGETFSLDNPEHAQPLQFILHALPGFNPGGRAERVKSGSSSDARTATEFFVEGNDANAAPSNEATAGNVLLLPANAKEIHASGDTAARMDGDALILTASNPTNVLRRETDKLPSWNVTLDMSHRRGLGMWITGDHSGALLLVKLARRDYVVPMDFEGRRYVEIPNGEVSWASSNWGWRMETKSADYSRVRTVQMGFGQLPPGAKAQVKVEQLTALGEVAVGLENPVVQVGSGQLRVQGTVGSGQFLHYAGGDTATLYDGNWHQLGRLPVEKVSYTMPPGQNTVTLTTKQVAPTPWLSVQFIVTGTPMVLNQK